MKWNDLYPSDKQPSFENIADYVGKVKKLSL